MLKFSGYSSLRSAQKIANDKILECFFWWRVFGNNCHNFQQVVKRIQTLFFLKSTNLRLSFFETSLIQRYLWLLKGTICVQEFDDSLNPAIHTTYRISLRSSSLREPRDPLPRIYVRIWIFFGFISSVLVLFSKKCKKKEKSGNKSAKSLCLKFTN